MKPSNKLLITSIFALAAFSLSPSAEARRYREEATTGQIVGGTAVGCVAGAAAGAGAVVLLQTPFLPEQAKLVAGGCVVGAMIGGGVSAADASEAEMHPSGNDLQNDNNSEADSE